MRQNAEPLGQSQASADEVSRLMNEGLVDRLCQWRSSAPSIDEEAYRMLIDAAHRLEELTAALETIIRSNKFSVDIARRALRAPLISARTEHLLEAVARCGQEPADQRTQR